MRTSEQGSGIGRNWSAVITKSSNDIVRGGEDGKDKFPWVLRWTFAGEPKAGSVAEASVKNPLPTSASAISVLPTRRNRRTALVPVGKSAEELGCADDIPPAVITLSPSKELSRYHNMSAWPRANEFGSADRRLAGKRLAATALGIASLRPPIDRSAASRTYLPQYQRSPVAEASLRVEAIVSDF